MTSSPEIPPATKSTAPPPARRWYRRRRVWLLMTLSFFLISGVAFHWFLSLGSKTALELYEKFSEKGNVDIEETALVDSVEWALEKIAMIPGTQGFAEEIATQILIPSLKWTVEFDQTGQTTLVDQDFADLAKLKNVIAINFADHPLNETRLAHLSRMIWLEQLSLDLTLLEERDESDIEVTNATSESSEALFKPLQQLHRLKKLTLVGEMSPTLAAWIASQSDLQTLDLTCSEVTVEFLQSFTKLKNLTSLKLHAALAADSSENRTTTAVHRQQTVVAASNANLVFPQLRHLWLCTGNNPGVEDIVHQLFQNKQLTNLELGTLGLTSPLVADISAMRHLTQLNFFSQKPLKTEHLRVAASLPELTSLTLDNCRLEEDVIDVINDCLALRDLKIRHSNLSNTTLPKLKNGKLLIEVDRFKGAVSGLPNKDVRP